LIWYGKWTSVDVALQVVPEFINSLKKSSFMNIASSYTMIDSSTLEQKTCTNTIQLQKGIMDSYSQGSNITQQSLKSIVTRAIANGLPDDPTQGLYLILGTSDVSQMMDNSSKKFCKDYCGFHDFFENVTTKQQYIYSYVGDPTTCLSSCTLQTQTSPNNNPAVDGMLSVIAHEIMEVITDPKMNAYFDDLGQENGDKCAWKYGRVYTASNRNSIANMLMDGKDYLIQSVYINKVGAVMGYCGNTN
jgi:hypothetical protein